MSEFLQKIVYLSQSDYATLAGGGSLTRNGTTLTGINDNYIYVTDAKITLSDLDNNLVLPVSKGGTGGVTWPADAVLLGNGGNTLTTIGKASVNTANTLVQRDASGNFSAGTVTVTALTATSATIGSMTFATTAITGTTSITTTGGNGLLAYKPSSWTGVSNSKWGVGTIDVPGVIRSSNADLEHSRNGSNSAILDTGNYTTTVDTRFYKLDGSNTGIKLAISTQSSAYTNGIVFLSSSTKKGNIGVDTNGTVGIYGSKISLRPVLDAATDGVEITTAAMTPTKTNAMTLGGASNVWSTLYTNYIDITHIQDASQEIRIHYSTTVDFSLMVGTGNANHGLYDNKKSAWVLSAGTDNNWSLNGSATKWTAAQKVYVALGTASTTTTIQGGSSSAQTIGVNGTLAIANGGTGATDAAGARANLGAAASDHVHGNITNTGTITATGVALDNNDTLVIVDSSDSSKIKQTSIKFDGSTTTTALTQKGTWETFAKLASPAFTGTPTAPTANAGTNTTQIATTAFVANAIASVAGPMRFRGSLGTGGTITSLPTAATSNQGDTYKVITQGTYASTVAKPGDVFISSGNSTTGWVYIPSGDEPTGTVTSITLAGGAGIDIDDTTALTTSGIRTITNTGVRSITTGSTAGTISVNTGGTLTDVAVNGLGNLAFLDSVTITKAQLDLENVDNVSLLSWEGSTNIKTVGAIETGTWESTPIGIAYGGTGATTAAAAWAALGGGASGTHPENYYALANHNYHVPTPQTANNAVYLRNDNTWHTLVPSDINAAPIASPALTGTPTAPTASAGTNTTQIATTEFVTTAINNIPHSELVHTQSVTIAVADWSSSNTCTKTVSGVTSSMIVIVAPAAGSYGVSTTAGVYCTDQGTDTLSFACLFSKPTAAVTINVAMIG